MAKNKGRNNNKPHVKLPAYQRQITPVSPYTVDTTSMMPSTTAITGPSVKAKTTTPRIFIKPKAKLEMDYIVDKCEQEVGWMCTVKDLGDNIFYIDKVYLPKQEVSPVETDIDPDSLAEVYMDIANSGGDPSSMYAWFHSHVNMGVTPSAQDESQVETFLQTLPVLIRGIMNKKGAIKVDVYLRDEGLAFNSVTVEVAHPTLTAEEEQALDASILEKVTERPAPTRFGLNGYSGNNYSGNNYGHGYGSNYGKNAAVGAQKKHRHGSNLTDRTDDFDECDSCGTLTHFTDLTLVPAKSVRKGVFNTENSGQCYCPDCMEALAQSDFKQTQALQQHDDLYNPTSPILLD